MQKITERKTIVFNFRLIIIGIILFGLGFGINIFTSGSQLASNNQVFIPQ